MNVDGMQYYDKMDYIPYSYSFLYDKYEKKKNVKMFNENKEQVGAAGIHNLFHEKLSQLEDIKLYEYAAYNTLVEMGIALCASDPVTLECFRAYAYGKGGEYDAWVDGYSRKYINVCSWIKGNFLDSNSANDYYRKNMQKVMIVLENVLNEYNQEVYLSVSPDVVWRGCNYVDYSELTPANAVESAGIIICNIDAFGTFNSADAGITLHCTYDPKTEEYVMQFKYYLIDYYDYDFLEILNQQDALGIARGYESGYVEKIQRGIVIDMLNLYNKVS